MQLDTDSDGDNIDDAYIPGSADSQSETETENDDASEKSPVYQRKIIVFEEQLYSHHVLMVIIDGNHNPLLMREYQEI